jgi:hypothetical protein
MCHISPVRSKSSIQTLAKLQRLMKLQQKPQKPERFKEKDANCEALVSEMRGLLAKRQKETIFLQENTRRLQNLSQKSRKGQIPKKLASKSKKLELNCTSLMLNSKNTRSDHAIVPDLGVSSGLYIKNKTIRVLLDSGLSGDLLFMKKGSSKCISIVKRVVPQSWGTSNGTFVTDKVGDIEISFVEYSARKKVCLQPDIVEYSPGEQAPMYDLIIGKQTMHDLGVCVCVC